MSKFMLSMGLVLASAAGFSSAGQGVELAQPAQTAAFNDDFEYTDFGPYDYLTDAITERDAWRADGYGANVITKDDGYWVRVFEK